MSCELYEIGARVELVREIALALAEGDEVYIRQGSEGRVTQVNHSAHQVEVYFSDVDQTLTVDARQIRLAHKPGEARQSPDAKNGFR